MMLIGDDDETVRAHAASCLIELHRGDENRGLCRLLAAFVLNESERLAVRRIAYAGILAIQGRKLEQPIWKSMKSCEAGLPEDLDWQLVRDCVRSK